MLDRFFDVVANLGLMVRDTRPKHIAAFNRDREWGTAVAGIALSIKAVETSGRISVAFRNETPYVLEATLPDWLAYLTIELEPALMPTAYGRQLLAKHAAKAPTLVVFSPGTLLETEVPVSVIYGMKPGREYRIAVFCAPPQGTGELQSNSISLSIV